MAAKRARHQARRRGGNGLPGWAWLLIGLLLGALVFGFLHMRDTGQSLSDLLPRPDPDAKAPASGSGDEPVVPETPEKPKPKYDFYTLLPEKEVVIPDAELDAQARAEMQAAPPSPNPSDAAAITNIATTPADTDEDARYLIQAGAFKTQADAETLKAQIALTGEVARVETAEIAGATVYRVRMGPYASAGSLAAAKQTLASHGIAAQAIRVK